MLSVTYKHFHAKCRCAECRYAKYRYDECRGAFASKDRSLPTRCSTWVSFCLTCKLKNRPDMASVTKVKSFLTLTTSQAISR